MSNIPEKKIKTEEFKTNVAKKEAKEPAAGGQQADPLPSGIVTDLIYFNDTYLVSNYSLIQL